MQSFFECRVSYYNDTAEGIVTERVLTYGFSYAEAMGRIEDCYGDDLIKVEIYAVEPGEVYIFGMADSFCGDNVPELKNSSNN